MSKNPKPMDAVPVAVVACEAWLRLVFWAVREALGVIVLVAFTVYVVVALAEGPVADRAVGWRVPAVAVGVSPGVAGVVGLVGGRVAFACSRLACRASVLAVFGRAGSQGLGQQLRSRQRFRLGGGRGRGRGG